MKEVILVFAAGGLLTAYMVSGNKRRSIYYEMAAGATDAAIAAVGDKLQEASDAFHGEWGDEWDWMANQPFADTGEW